MLLLLSLLLPTPRGWSYDDYAANMEQSLNLTSLLVTCLGAPPPGIDNLFSFSMTLLSYRNISFSFY